MRSAFHLFIAAALAVASLAGCDRQNGDRRADARGQAAATPMARRATAALGPGWRGVADGRASAWGFAPEASPSDGDPLESIRAALDANMLPPRGAVRIADMVNRLLPPLPPATPDAPSSIIVMTSTPWNQDTLLLWVEVRNIPTGGASMVSVEFDPKTVAAYRPLGDASALPASAGPVRRAAMLYELSLRPEIMAAPGRRYATVHVAAQTATASSNFIPTIDDAPAIVRLAAAAAGFGGLLRGDPAVRDLSCNDVIALAEGADQPDPDGARTRMIDMMRRAEPLIDLPPSDASAQDDAAQDDPARATVAGDNGAAPR